MGLPSVRGMLIDCDTCTAGPRACGDCIVTHLLSVGSAHQHGATAAGARPTPELTSEEVVAVGVLAAGGLVPPLRLVTPGRTDPQMACLESEEGPQDPAEGLGTGARAG